MLPLASGSKGNCTYIQTPHSQALIDCGIGPRRLFRELRQHGIDPKQIDSVFITHMHSDHINGLPGILKHISPSVYGHRAALLELARYAGMENRNGNMFSGFDSNQGFHHRDMDVLPVEVSHDCPPTVVFKVFCGKRRLGVLTDLGETSVELAMTFGDCDAMVLEANHCPEMLSKGPYPEGLKSRIRSGRGHLSNDQSAMFATGLSRMPSKLMLGHLSESNNTPQAVSAAFNRVETGPIPHEVLSQHEAGPVVELSL